MGGAKPFVSSGGFTEVGTELCCFNQRGWDITGQNLKKREKSILETLISRAFLMRRFLILLRIYNYVTASFLPPVKCNSLISFVF